MITHFLEALDNSWLAGAIADSPVLFPLIEAVHVLTAAFLVGSIAIVDLRLLGLVGRDHRPQRFLSDILPWAWGMFALASITGSLLFISQATRYAGDIAFRLKLVFIMLAALNMILFHFVIGRDVSHWHERAPTPAPAKIAGVVSLLLWSAAIFSARWIYFSIFG